MKIIGIDPGPLTSGYVVWSPLLCRVLEAGTDVDNARLRREILPGFGLRFGDTSMQLAVERVACHGRPVGEPVLETVFLSGRLCEWWELTTGQRAIRVPFSDIAHHFCHSRHAKESHVRQVLMDRFGGKGTAKAPGVFYKVAGHAWSAAALSVYVMDQAAQPGLAGRDDRAGTDDRTAGPAD